MAEREKNMRNMKKALAAVAAVATLASLAACGGSDGGNDAKANAGDADKADLVFWGWDTGNTMKALIADFEKANPGITVKFNNTGTASDTQTALSNAVAAGKGAPDVVMLEDPTVTQFAVTGDLVDLTAYGMMASRMRCRLIPARKSSSTTMPCSRRPASTAPRSRLGTIITRQPRRSRPSAPT